MAADDGFDAFQREVGHWLGRDGRSSSPTTTRSGLDPGRRRRPRRRFPGAGPCGRREPGVGHRVLRRPLHGGDGEDPVALTDGALPALEAGAGSLAGRS